MSKQTWKASDLNVEFNEDDITIGQTFTLEEGTHHLSITKTLEPSVTVVFPIRRYMQHVIRKAIIEWLLEQEGDS